MPAEEPTIALPTARLLTASWLACALCAGAWALVAWIVGWDVSALVVGPLGAATVGVALTAGLLVITPWKQRPVSLWMTLWLAGTVLRLVLTPALAFLLYSAASFSATRLAIAVVIPYLVALLSEVLVLARHMNRVVPA